MPRLIDARERLVARVRWDDDGICILDFGRFPLRGNVCISPDKLESADVYPYDSYVTAEVSLAAGYSGRPDPVGFEPLRIPVAKDWLIDEVL